MHELSICQALMEQLDQIALEQQATAIEQIVLQIDPLSRLEPHLFKQAFPLASAGSLAATVQATEASVRCVVIKGFRNQKMTLSVFGDMLFQRSNSTPGMPVI